MHVITANPFIPNDDCNTALEVAREKGHVNVVRAIEVYHLLHFPYCALQCLMEQYLF